MLTIFCYNVNSGYKMFFINFDNSLSNTFNTVKVYATCVPMLHGGEKAFKISCYLKTCLIY